MFQSPCGCELQLMGSYVSSSNLCFNPLAGVSCNLNDPVFMTLDREGFNPLAGVSCNMERLC